MEKRNKTKRGEENRKLYAIKEKKRIKRNV